MIVKRCKEITEREIAEMAKNARGAVNRIYLHWTAGYYGQPYDDYHFCVDREGQVYVHCKALTEEKEHTWLRNCGAVAIALCCGAQAACWAPQTGNCRTAWGALAAADYAAPDCARICLGEAPPTVPQIEVMAKVVALLCDGLELPICRDTVQTHCEVAFKDGYGPGSGDPETRWDLWFLPDVGQHGKLMPGGELLRGKALYYRNLMQKGGEKAWLP